MNWKKLLHALLFPHIAILIILLPVATVFLVCAMLLLGSESPISIVSYVLAAYTLTVWCVRMPQIIRFFKTFKNENRYVQIWLTDTRLRIKVTLFGTFLWNFAYACFQFGLGLFHASFWYTSMAIYYLLLGVMRLFLAWHTQKHEAGTHMRLELQRYRACGWIFLFMNLALSLMVFFMVYWNRTFVHHEITTIAMAAYTFTSFTLAIINVVKYRRYNSPVYSASKVISFASACVSMLTLETTMLTVFGTDEMDLLTRRLFLAISGGVISLLIVAMAIYMIVTSTKSLHRLNRGVQEKENNNG